MADIIVLLRGEGRSSICKAAAVAQACGRHKASKPDPSHVSSPLRRVVKIAGDLISWLGTVCCISLFEAPSSITWQERNLYFLGANHVVCPWRPQDLRRQISMVAIVLETVE